MSESYPCSLVLAAHGSIAEADSNQPLIDVSEKLDRQRIFSQVTPAFLNGDPSLETVLDSLPIGDVIVIPMMTSEGYFASEIVPEKLRSNSTYKQHRVLLTPVLGMHPRIAEFAAARIVSTFVEFELPPHETAVVLIGHGTKRNPNSGASTYELQNRVQKQLGEIDIHVAFIDQDPQLDDVVATLDGQHCLAIPFLISRGPHATVDVPASLGLPTGPAIEFPIVCRRPDRTMICDLPIGMYPGIEEICIELAADKMLSVPHDPNYYSTRRELL